MQARAAWRWANFYPRPPRGGRHGSWASGLSFFLFLSTPSARRATSWAISRCLQKEISIHALREEGDRITINGCIMRLYFYPRPPRGGRPKSPHTSFWLSIFLSTPSARRATEQGGEPGGVLKDFYPRPPRGGRRNRMSMDTHTANFYPRPPRGGRQGGAV